MSRSGLAVAVTVAAMIVWREERGAMEQSHSVTHESKVLSFPPLRFSFL